MPEPITTITLAGIGMAAITEGIKFLYNQAGELIKWRREKRASAHDARPNLLPRPETILPPGAPPNINEEALNRLEDPVNQLCDKLSGVVSGRTRADLEDPALLGNVDALRRALEAILGQPLTFQGEKRADSQGPTVVGVVNVKDVEGYVAGVAAGTIKFSRNVEGHVRADKVGSTGTVIGVHVTDA